MVSQPSQLCYDSLWYRRIPMAIFGLIAYGAGIPLLFGAVLYRYRHRLSEEKFINRLGCLFYIYKKKAWFWEIVVKLR